MLTTPLSLTTFRARWLARRDELRRLHALVDGAELCDTLLAELDALVRASADAPLSLQHAAAESGYSADHLGRLVREGKLPNAGRPNAPKIRRGDLPQKAGTLPTAPLLGSVQDPKRRVAQACVNLDRGERHG